MNWFNANDMTVNPAKFQVLITGRDESIKDKYTLKINDTGIVTKSSITLLTVEIDKRQSFMFY